MEKNIRIQYYAIFREARGKSSESVTTGAQTPRELFEELHLDSAFPFDAQRLKVALNDEFASWDAALSSGDTVVFIAPVSGG